jgi:superfamily II DNA/RNA helicase
LTGTPLQNSTDELWSLLNFCSPLEFCRKDEFVEKFGSLSDAQQVKELHNVLKPYLLRRVKEDVEKSLPPKEETIIEVALTPIQKKYYKAIYERNTFFLMKGSKPSNSPSLMNITMELRKCCNHPFLIKGAEDRIMKEASDSNNEADAATDISRYRTIFTEQLVQSSGKMVLLMKLLPKLQTGGHKVLIFSQMVKVLDLLEELMKLKNYSYERLDGSVSAFSRNAAVRRFNGKIYDKFIMLLSTRAGGLGLNLTRADTVIIYDSDWNPQNDLQAMARAHRIGQTKPVHVYRLLTAKTYEMHMFHSASMKLGLDRAVLAHQRHQGIDGKGHSKKRSKESQAKEIDELLKKGAYDVFTDEDDSEAKIFMETDIDMLLERNSRTVSYERNQSSISSGLGSFNKASFITSDANGLDVDLDDPNFWEALGLDYSNGPQDENVILDGKKRIRKQVQIFDPYFHEDKEYEHLFDDENHELLQQQEKRSKKTVKKEGKGYGQDTRNVTATDANFVTICQENDKTHLAKLESKLQVRRLRQIDPIAKHIRSGWDADSRDRIIKALLSHGFGRFCKIRHEAGLSNLPLQDIEIFARTCK